MKKNIQSFKVLILSIILLVGVSLVYAGPTPVPGSPTSNNADAPLNISTQVQSRSGSLTLGTADTPSATLDVRGTLSTNGMTVFANTNTAELNTDSLSLNNIQSSSIYPLNLCANGKGSIILCKSQPLSLCQDTDAANYQQLLPCKYAHTFESNIDESWTAPADSTDLDSVMIELWGAGGSGGIALTGSNESTPTDTVFTGPSNIITAYHGNNASSSSIGTGGLGGSITGIYDSFIKQNGGNGSSSTYNNPQTPIVVKCDANYALVFHNNGSDGAIAGKAYKGSYPNDFDTPHSAGLSPQSIGENIGQGTGYYEENPFYYSNNNFTTLNCNNTPYIDVNHTPIPARNGDGVIPGGGGSSIGGRSGNWGKGVLRGGDTSGSLTINDVINCGNNNVNCLGNPVPYNGFGGGAGGYVKAVLKNVAGQGFSWTIGKGGIRRTAENLDCSYKSYSQCPDPGKGGNGRVKITYYTYTK